MILYFQQWLYTFRKMIVHFLPWSVLTFYSDDYYRLRQNEYSFVTDVLSCSYHPKECTCDATIINHRVEYHKISYGTVGLTFPCFQSRKDPKQVALSKSIQTSQMIHAVIWPVLGAFQKSKISFFAKHHFNEPERLYRNFIPGKNENSKISEFFPEGCLSIEKNSIFFIFGCRI